MQNSLFSGKLNNNVSCELVESISLSGNTEVGLKINGEIVNVVSINQKRTGVTECKTVDTKTVVINPISITTTTTVVPKQAPTLEYIAPRV